RCRDGTASRRPGRAKETAASDYGGDSVKVVGVQDTNLEDCVRQARRGQVLLTRRGKPVAVLIDVRGLDQDQAELGVSDAFWSIIRERRKQRTVSRAELDKRLAGP